MSTTTKPALPKLQTPVTSTFPSELSTPVIGFVDFIKAEDIKTPITPPLAYTDFLKTMASPISITGSEKSGRTTPTSAPSTGSSEHSDCSCACETHKSPVSTTAPLPYLPTSAHSTSSRSSTSWLGRLRIPPSPSYSDSPLSAPLTASSMIRSPYASRTPRSARSPYDWDGKGRYFDIKSPKTTRTSVREVREIVTRTVTYTPRMSPAPKGKRRKIEHE